MPKNPELTNPTLSRIKRRILKHYNLVRFLIIASTLSVFFLVAVFLFVVTKRFLSWEYFLAARNFLTTQTDTVAQTNSHTNILILGKGGTGHTAPDLTDTMIIASVLSSLDKAALVSIPRDLWIDDLETRINSIYEKGNAKSSGGGLILAKSVVEEIVGQPIHYAVAVDFNNFKELIDAIGGIEVNVENSFTDKLYPIAGLEEDLCGGDIEYKCRYEILVFEKGISHMDGELALKFARSRYAEGDEGTDIARQARQQKVIEALKSKLSNPKLYTNLKANLVLLRIVRSSLETDLTLPGMATLARRVIKSQGFTNYVIPETLIFHPSNPPLFNRIYVFVPKKGWPSEVNDWSDIHKWFLSILAQ